MKIRIYSLLLCGFALGSLSALAQQSPLLEKYRTMALDYNHDLKAAEKNIAASMEVEKSARADLKPKLSGAASFQYTGNPMELTLDIPSIGLSKTVEGKNLNYGGSLSILQPVYTGGRVLESIRMAQHQQALVGNQAKALNDAVCYQTDIQYWSAVARQEIVDVALHALRQGGIAVGIVSGARAQAGVLAAVIVVAHAILTHIVGIVVVLGGTSPHKPGIGELLTHKAGAYRLTVHIDQVASCL